MPSAMIRPSKQTCQDRRCTPPVNVPSDTNVKIASPVALALKFLCTVGNSIMFMTIRNASQCSACVTTRRHRAAASLAKAYCSEAYYHCAAETIQIFGGVGFTWEYDPHLYFKRARASESLLGPPAWHRERVARAIGL